MERPTSVTVFGILNIVFAALGMLSLVSSINLLSGSSAVSKNPALKFMLENQDYLRWMKISVPLGLVAAIVLLVAGIGLLKLKPWARIASIGYGVYAILFGIASSIVTAMVLVRPALEQMQAQGNQSPEAAGAMGGAIGGALGGCFGCIYPILLIIFMTRPKVVAAFQQPPAIPGAGLQG